MTRAALARNVTVLTVILLIVPTVASTNYSQRLHASTQVVVRTVDTKVPIGCPALLKNYEEFLSLEMATLNAEGIVSHDSATVILVHAKISHELSQKCSVWFKTSPPVTDRERAMFDEARRVDALAIFSGIINK